MKMFIYNPNLSYCSILTLSQYPPMHTTAISVRVVWNEIFRSCQSLIISILPALTWGKECFAYQSSLHQNGFENVLQEIHIIDIMKNLRTIPIHHGRKSYNCSQCIPCVNCTTAHVQYRSQLLHYKSTKL